MANLKDITAFYLQNYPFPDELSKARLTKMVYLADWESAKRNQSQMSEIQWIFHNFGPYVDDVIDTVNSEPIFKLEETQNMHGGKKGIIRIVSPYTPELSEKDKEILNDIISETKSKYWDSFIEYVYNTYPIRNSDRFDDLDLVSFAKEEQSIN